MKPRRIPHACLPPLLATALLAVALLGSGCATLEVWQGARLYQAGTRALEAGQPELAIFQLELAAQRVPRASEVHNHLGLAYAAAGRDDEALAAFEQAVALDCRNDAAQANLAAALAHAHASAAGP